MIQSQTNPFRQLHSPSWQYTLLRLGILALVYWLASITSFALHVDGIVTIWIAGGVALAALVLGKPNERPAIVATVFATSLVSNLIMGYSLGVSIGLATANTLESVMGALFMLGWCGEKITFRRFADTVALILVTSLVNVCTAILGAFTMSVDGNQSLGDIWGHWIITHGLGLLIVTPLIVTWARLNKSFQGTSRIRKIEAILVFLALIILAQITTIDIQEETFLALRNYVFFPIMIWLAWRFSPREVITALALVSALVLMNTMINRNNPVTETHLIYIQLYLIIVTSTTILLSAIFTERQQTENDHQAMIHTSLDGYWKLDYAGNLIEVNNAYCRMSGYSRAELLQMHISDIDADETPEQTRTHLAQVIGHGYDRFESRHRRKDGSLINVEVSTMYLGMPEHGLCAFVRNITESIRAEEALQESTHIFKLITENISEVFWLADPQLAKTFYISPSYERIWGKTSASLYENPQSYIDAIHPEDRQRVLNDYKNKEMGQPFKHEYRIIRADGSTRWIMDSGFPIRSETGEISNYVGIARDITERQLIEDKLRESENRYRQLIEILPDLVAVHKNGKIVFINTAGAQLVKAANPEEIIGKPITDFLLPEHTQVSKQRTDKLLVEGKPSPVYEQTLVCLDGSRVEVEIIGSPFRYQDETAIQIVAHNITKRKQAEETLRASEARLKAYFDLARVAISILDLNGKWIQANKRAQELFGYSVEELGRLTTLDITYPDDVEASRQGLHDLAHGKLESYHLEKRNICKNGSVIWIDVSATAICDNNGKPIAFISAAFDITERKQIEQALRESEEKFRTIAEQMSEMVFVTDLQGTITYCSPTVQSLFGYTAREMQGRVFINFLTERDIPTALASFQNALAESKQFENLELEMLRKDGSTFWGEWNGTLYRKDGVVIGSAGLIRDITSRKQADAKLRTLSRAVESSSASIVITDINGAIEYVNPIFTTITGYTFDEAIGQNPRILKSGLTPPEVYSNLWQTIQAGGVWHGEFCNKKKTGEIYWESASISPVTNEEGKITHFVAVKEDITERKRVEQELRVQRNFATQVMNTMGQGLSVTDEQGRFEFINPAYARMLGCTQEQVIGKVPADFTFSQDQETLAQARLERLEGKSGSYETRLLRSDGNVIDALITGVPRLRDGKYAGAIAVITDLTERKRIEAISAARSRILQFSLSHSLPEILQNVLDECETLTLSSIGFFHFMLPDQNTLSLQTWSTRTIKEFCHAEGNGLHYALSQAGVWADCVRERRAIISNDYATLPNRKGMPNGHAAVNRFVSIPILRGENIVAIIGVGNKPTDYSERDIQAVTQLADLSWDIAERKRAEDNLRTSENKYRSLFENAAVPIWEQDFSAMQDFLNGLGNWKEQDLREYLDLHPEHLAHAANLIRVIDINQESVAIFSGYRKDEISRYLPDYFVDESWQVFKEEIASLMEGETRFESELPFLDPKGKTKRSILRLSVVPGYEQSLARVLVSFIDITERKKMEEELGSLSRRLFEAEENERRNIARELHDEIGQVLTAVKSNLQTSKLLSDPEMSASFLNESIGIVDQALQQVRDLSLNLRPSLLDDFGLVPALEWYLNRQAHRMNVTAKFIAEPREMKLPQTLATTCFRIAQAALTNIERHAQAKHVRVTVHLRNRRTDSHGKRSELQLEITDDGIGFDVETILEGTKKGNTLGLAGMQERVRLAGGSMEIHSQPMRGTEIIAYFPIVQPNIERRTRRRIE
jgi:PAS domain S-box-containing protein